MWTEVAEVRCGPGVGLGQWGRGKVLRGVGVGIWPVGLVKILCRWCLIRAGE